MLFSLYCAHLLVLSFYVLAGKVCWRKSVTRETTREVVKNVVLPPASELSFPNYNSKLDCTELKVEPFCHCCAACAKHICVWAHYASPTSGEAYRNRRLTTNFVLWVEIFCVPTCFHMRIPKPCLSAPREKKSPYLRQYQSYISNWYINGKVFTSTTAWKPKNLIFFSKKFEIQILTCDEELKSP